MAIQKTTVVVVFGGQSTEHEISCRSAAYLVRKLPRERFNLAALAVSKDGVLLPQDLGRIDRENLDTIRIVRDEQADPASKQAFERLRQFVNYGKSANVDDKYVVFSIMHGTYGEDGCWQGYWELADLPYVGADSLGSAVSMDKELAKQLVSLAGVPIVPYLAIEAWQWKENSSGLLDLVEQHIPGSKFFVKPASLGSSVGVGQAQNREELGAAITEALRYDFKVLVEQGMNVREIEFAVLGGEKPKISQPGEVVATSGFYSYETKYLDADAAKILIPAPLAEHKAKQGKELAIKAFQALKLYGLARIDLFLDKDSDEFYFNEANTLPGFTSVSQYPLLWQHMGLSAGDLLSELVELATLRHQRRRSLRRQL